MKEFNGKDQSIEKIRGNDLKKTIVVIRFLCYTFGMYGRNRRGKHGKAIDFEAY